MESILKDFEKNGICMDSTNNRFQLVLDFQDAVGHNSMNNITEQFLAMDKLMRGLFVWACGVCLDKDMFISIVKANICDAIILEEESRLYNEHEKRLSDIIERESAMNVLQAENRIMKETIEALKKTNSLQDKNIQEMANKAASYDTIKRLLR